MWCKDEFYSEYYFHIHSYTHWWKETMCENLGEHATNVDEIMLSYFAAYS